jgi:hypothetical protein
MRLQGGQGRRHRQRLHIDTIDTDNDYTIDYTSTAHFLFLIPPHNPSVPPIDNRKDKLDVATDPKDDNALAATSSANHPQSRLHLQRQERQLRRRPPQPRLRQRLRPRHARTNKIHFIRRSSRPDVVCIPKCVEGAGQKNLFLQEQIFFVSARTNKRHHHQVSCVGLRGHVPGRGGLYRHRKCSLRPVSPDCLPSVPSPSFCPSPASPACPFLSSAPAVPPSSSHPPHRLVVLPSDSFSSPSSPSSLPLLLPPSGCFLALSLAVLLLFLVFSL